MTTRKITEFFEDRIVAEIHEKVRDTDGKRFYDTVIYRRYHNEQSEECRVSDYHYRDLDSIHVLLVRAKAYIKNQLWKNRGEYSRPTPEDSDVGYTTEE